MSQVASKSASPYGPEIDLWRDGLVVIGTDEAGRGPLAGPVVAAAVAFEPSVQLSGIGDSKTLTGKQREALFDQICECCTAHSIVAVEADRIDQVNILQATREAMAQAANDVRTRIGSEWPTLLVDGRIPLLGCGRQVNLIRGDSRSFSIGAASILAKVYRDRLMADLDRRYPEYGFSQHKGYPTAIHRSVLLAVGRSPIHRCSFTIEGHQGERIAIGELPLAHPLGVDR